LQKLLVEGVIWSPNPTLFNTPNLRTSPHSENPGYACVPTKLANPLLTPTLAIALTVTLTGDLDWHHLYVFTIKWS